MLSCTSLSFRMLLGLITFLASAAVAACPASAATVDATWLGGTGTWTVGAWSSTPFYPNNGVPPGTTYNAIINSGGTVTVSSRIVVDNVTVNNGGSLRIAGSIGNQTAELRVLQQLTVNSNAGTVDLDGGTFSGMIAGIGSTPVLVRTISLDAARLNIDTIFDSGTTGTSRIHNGLTTYPNRTYTIANTQQGSQVTFEDDATLADGTILLARVGGGDPNRASTILTPNATLTIGANAFARTENGHGAFDAGTLGALVNHGTISAATAGKVLSFYGSVFNQGTILIAPGASLAFNGAKTEGLGTILNSGGTLRIGSLDNNNATLLINANTGSIVHNNGTITGGTIRTVDNTAMVINDSGGWLKNVAFDGDLRIGAPTLSGDCNIDGTFTLLNGARVHLKGGPQQPAEFACPANFTLAGDGEVLFEANVFDVMAQYDIGTMSIGSGITVRTAGGSGQIGNGDSIGTMKNFGTISAESSGQTLRLGSPLFINEGLLRAVNAASFSTKGNMVNNGRIVIDSAGVGSIATTLTGNGTLTVGAGTLTVNNIRQVNVSIGSNGVVNTRVNSAVSRISQLSVAPSAKLDLANNDLVIDDGSIETIRALIVSARAGGAWTGTGITSSSAAAQPNHATTLGVMSGADFFEATGDPNATFDGESIDADTSVVKYTWYGDADFNGIVNFDDYSRIDNGFNNGLNGWANGDFDLNGAINFDDYSLIDLAFNTQSGALRDAGMSMVPEPSTLTMLGAIVLGALGFRARRRAALSIFVGVMSCTLLLSVSQARAQTLSEWTFEGAGTWENPDNWSTAPFFPNNNNPPGTIYDVHISASNVASVTLASNVTVNSILMDRGAVTFTQNAGVLDLTGQSTFTITNGSYLLQSGTLRGATLGGDGGLARTTGSGTFDTVTLARRFEVNAGTLNLVNNLTLASGSISLGANRWLNTFGAVEINGFGTISAAGGTISVQSLTAAPGRLTIGADATVQRMSGTGSFNIGSATAEIVNNGTIRNGVNFFSPMIISAGSFINNGTLRTSNETLVHVRNLDNRGTITLFNGSFGAGSMVFNGNTINSGTISAGSSELVFNDTWSNTGTITLTGFASVIAGGTFQTSSLAGIGHTGANSGVEVRGWMDNTANTANVTALRLRFAGTPVIAGGTLVTTASNVFNGALTLDGVTIDGDISVGSSMFFRNGVELNNHTISLGGALTLVDDASLNGSGTIVFNGGQLVLPQAAGSLHTPIGFALITAPNRAMMLGNVSMPLVNHGLIQSGFTGSTISASEFTNLGTINVTSGTFNFTGNFKRSGLGTIQVASGANLMLKDATLDLEGTVFDISEKPWRLNNGTLSNGTVTRSASGPHVVDFNATLDQITLDTDLFVKSVTLTARNSLDVDDRYIVLNDSGVGTLSASTLSFPETQSINGPAHIIFNGVGDNSAIHTDGELTIGSDVRIEAITTGGTIGAGLGRFINQGTIAVQSSTLTLRGDHWENQNIVQVNGGTLQLGGIFRSDAMGTIQNSGGTIVLTGLIDNTAQTLDLSAYGTMAINNGGVSGGNLLITDPALVKIVPFGSLTLSGVTLQSNLPASFTARTRTIGGITLDNVTVNVAGSNFISTSDQTLGGVGTVIMNGGTLSAGTIGAGVVVRGAGSVAVIGNNVSPMTNFGMVVNDLSNGTIQIRGKNITNFGTIAASAGAIELGGIVTPDALGTISITGSASLSLVGTLTLSGQTLMLSQATRDWTMNNSVLLNTSPRISGPGTIASADGTALRIAQSRFGVFINHPTLAANMFVSRQGSMVIDGTLTLAGGTINMLSSLTPGQFTMLNAGTNAFSLAGTGSVLFDGPDAGNLVNNIAFTDPGITFHTRSGGARIGGVSFQHRGRLLVDAFPVTVGPGGTFANVGLIDISRGGTVIGQGTLTNSGTINVGADSLLLINNNRLFNTGTIDVNAAVMIRYFSDPTPLPTIVAQIVNARNGGAWDQAGFTSSGARNAQPKITTLAAIEGSQWLTLRPGELFSGQTVDSTSVLVRYTYYGDTDLNGLVNFDDYSRIDAGFNGGGTGWVNGDFDLNGAINFDDYALMDLAFNEQDGSLQRAIRFLDGSDRNASTMNLPSLRLVEQHFARFGNAYASSFLSAVPEPGHLSACTLSAWLLQRRVLRRRAKI